MSVLAQHLPKTDCRRKLPGMDLYLMRHGIAEAPETQSSGQDRDRRLTPKGVRRVRQIAQAMKEMGLEFDRILSSPFRRARETAELVAEGLEAESRLKFGDHLAVPPDNLKLLRQIATHRPALERVLLVGHEPHLSELTSLLVAGSPDLRLTFRKGGLCRLSVESLHAGRCATLEWLLTPSQMLLMT